MGRLGRGLPGLLAAALLCGAAFWIALRINPLIIERMNLAVFDAFQEQVELPSVPEKILAVIATDKSLRELGHWPLPRATHAQVLGNLALARVVAVDLLFPEASNEKDDALLAATVGEMGNVVLAVHITADSGSAESQLVLPYPALFSAAAAFGFTNVRPETDGIYRNAYLVWDRGNSFIPSFPLAVWMEAKDDAPDLVRTESGLVAAFPNLTIETDPFGTFNVHHPREKIPVYEYSDVYQGKVAPETFRDAVVFVGASGAGTHDFFPIGGSDVPLAGVLYNAHAVQTLLQGWIPRAAPPWALIAAGLGMSLVGLLLGSAVRVNRGWIVMLAALVAWSSASAALFRLGGVWLPPVLPLLFGAIAFIVAMLLQLRSVSDRLDVQRFSVESQLLLADDRLDPSTTSFADFLTRNWEDIQSRSGVSVLVPMGPADEPEVAACLAKLAEGEAPPPAPRARGVQVAVIHEGAGVGNRLLLLHPSWSEEGKHYTVLTWRGEKSMDELKSVSVLVMAAATHYKALAEGRARRELFLGVIRLIMSAVDAKDPTTAGHSERVAVLARRLAEHRGLPRKEVDDIYLSGLLHDVGKIGIPDSILNFPGKLTEEDMEQMRRHPSLGSEMMNKITLPDVVLQGIIEHHERMDGKGYPRGLDGESLSLVGRILKVADVYDALRSRRQYKEPFPLDTVRDIFADGAGSEFDAGLVGFVMENPFEDLYDGAADKAGRTER